MSRPEASAGAGWKQRWVDGSLVSVGVVLVVALWAMVNYLSWRHYERLDWTSDRLYSLSERTESLLANLDRDIEFVAVLEPQNPAYPLLDELLDGYVAASPRVTRRDLDPALDPLEAQRLIEVYGIERSNVVVVASGEDRRVVDTFDMVEYDYAGASAGEGSGIRSFRGEAKLTSALLSLVEARKPRVVLTTGHGEATLAPSGGLGQLAGLLGADNFEIASWSSRDGGMVPAGTDLLAILGPQSAFGPAEVAAIGEYLEAGGRVLAALDPILARAGQLEGQSAAGGNRFVDLGLGDWLARYGIDLDQTVVLDPARTLPLYGAETFAASRYGAHPIVEALEQTGTPTVVSLARSLGLRSEAAAGVAAVELVSASPDAWGETDLDSLDEVAPDGPDRLGPFPLAVAVSFPGGSLDLPPLESESTSTALDADALDGDALDGDGLDRSGVGAPLVPLSATAEPGAANPASATASDTPSNGLVEESSEPSEARLIVIGDLDLLADAFFGWNGANELFATNAFNWLIERESLVEIEGRETRSSRLALLPGQLQLLAALFLLVMPGLAVVAGVWIAIRRRR